MKKKLFILILLFVSVISGIASGLLYNKQYSIDNSDNRIYAQAQRIYIDFDSLLEIADEIVTATVDNIVQHSDYDEYIVTITSSKKSNLAGQLSIRNYLCEYTFTHQETTYTGRTNTSYVVGKSYTFILQHVSNVYEDVYMILSDAYIPTDDIQSTSIMSVNLEEITDYQTYIDQYQFVASDGLGRELSIDYIESNDFDVIIKLTPVIAIIQVQEYHRSTEIVDVYSCQVVDTLKGSINTSENNRIIIPFFKDTVTSGEQYIVCLYSNSDDAIIYTLSSKDSLYEIEQLDIIKQKMG